MWNFGYHFARAEAQFIRNAYRRGLPRIVKQRVAAATPIDLDVFAYSGEAALPEQVASIRSFLRHVGRPAAFNVVSDGSYRTGSRALVESIDECVRVSDIPEPPLNLPEKFRSYLRAHPTGRQLCLMMSLPRTRPALYTDSDVLFFRGASILREMRTTSYLRDCKFSGDERLLKNESDTRSPVNTGVLLLQHALDWTVAAERFEILGDAPPSFFTNQTLTHFAMHANGAQPLDPAKFILQLDDQFEFRDRYAGDFIALRHYVNPVRHKFWTSLRRA